MVGLNCWLYSSSVVLMLCVYHLEGAPENNFNTHQNDKINPPENTLSKCAEHGGLIGILNCAAERSIRSLRASPKSINFEILPGVTVTGEAKDFNRKSKSLEQNELLPDDPKQRAFKLADVLIEAAFDFLSGRTLKIKFPEDSNGLARAFEEGRGKMKKMVAPFMLGLGAKMMGVLPMMFGGLGLLATKALVVSKIAFVLAVICFVQYFFPNRGLIPAPFSGSGYNTGYGYGTYGSYGPPGWSTNQIGGGQYPYARSLDIQDELKSQEAIYKQGGN